MSHGGRPPSVGDPTAAVRVDVRGWGWRHAGRRAWALRDLDLRIEPGQRVLLLGSSGSGKSTLLAALAGLLDPSDAGEQEGEVRLDGRPARQVRPRAGLVMQDPEAALVMARCGDDVAFGLENRGVPTAEIWPRVDEALAAVGFRYGRDHPTGALSGGEQQRLAVAGILALRPGLLLLDEVTANLDPHGARLVHRLLSDVLASTGATAVVVEHRVEQVLDLVDRAVVVAAGGGVLADGTPAEVFRAQGEWLAAAGVWVPGRHPAVHRRSARPAGATLLAAEAVGYRYPAAPEPALAPTDALVRSGRALAVTGPNGSGKSTLALTLAGLLRPTEGRVAAGPGLFGPEAAGPGLVGPGPVGPGVAGPRLGRRGGDLPLWRWRARDLVRCVGTVFQDPEHQFVTASVRDELMVGPLRVGAGELRAAARADELMQRLGLAALARANPFTLSGGEKRRLSVATAIATGPPVVVADEPTFGQDARTWAGLADLLADLRDAGAALVLVTHDRALVDALADDELPLRRPTSVASTHPDRR